MCAQHEIRPGCYRWYRVGREQGARVCGTSRCQLSSVRSLARARGSALRNSARARETRVFRWPRYYTLDFFFIFNFYIPFFAEKPV